MLVTRDADFAEMAVLFGSPCKPMRLQGGSRPTAAVEQSLRRNHGLIWAFADEPEAACLELH